MTEFFANSPLSLTLPDFVIPLLPLSSPHRMEKVDTFCYIHHVSRLFDEAYCFEIGHVGIFLSLLTMNSGCQS